MENMKFWLGRVKELLEYPILRLGSSEITLWSVIYFGALLLVLVFIAGKLRKLLVSRVLAHSKLDVGARQAVGAIARYIFLFIGLLIIVQTVGINLTTLNVIAGAVSIGVGFGLQNVVSNFISGLIILFERPIKIGDRIEVGRVEGDVVAIGARSTTIVTNDNIAIIVPNSKFITESVVNWKYTDPTVRFKVPVGVAYGTDTKLVERVLLEAAGENPDVLADPPPSVRFIAFGDSALQFELQAWSTTLVNNKWRLISALNFAIYDKFNQNNIEIPFPQREIRLRSESADLSRTREEGVAS